MWLRCECCETETLEFERGWRAYRDGAGSVQVIAVVCPACAERVRGEDEAD
jgi:hypothetical protein